MELGLESRVGRLEMLLSALIKEVDELKELREENGSIREMIADLRVSVAGLKKMAGEGRRLDALTF